MESPDRALEEYAAREPVKYKMTLFRAFLGRTPEECSTMSAQDFNDDSIMLVQVLKMWHAPFQKHD